MTQFKQNISIPNTASYMGPGFQAAHGKGGGQKDRFDHPPA